MHLALLPSSLAALLHTSASLALALNLPLLGSALTMVIVQVLLRRWTLGGTALPVMERKTTPKWPKPMGACGRGMDAQ